MTKNEFIKNIAIELSVSPDSLEISSDLSSTGHWDSLSKMAILAFIDSQLGAEMPPGALQQCKTIGDLVTLVEDRLVGE